MNGITITYFTPFHRFRESYEGFIILHTYKNHPPPRVYQSIDLPKRN